MRNSFTGKGILREGAVCKGLTLKGLIRKGVILRASSFKGLVCKGIIYRGILFSQKTRTLLTDSFAHRMELFFARPVAVVGISGMIGGTLGFYFPFAQAAAVFLLLQLFLFLWQLTFLKKVSDSGFRTALVILALFLGIYCMSLISFQRSHAMEALRIEKTQAGGDSDSIFEGYIISISLPDENYKTYTLLWRGGVKIRFGSSRTDMAFGQHVRISGSLMAVPSARNPGGFDQKSYYERQGIFLSLDTYDSDIFIQRDSAVIPGLFVLLETAGLKLRQSISNLWSQVLNQEDASLLSGMILGDTSGMSDELKSAFRMCGLAHLTAVSGANVAYFLVPVSAFFQKLSGRRAVRQLFILLFLEFFGFLTGWTASVTRALFMSAGTVVSSFLMKRHDPVSAMFLTACILLFNNPFVCVDLGFLMSFCATLSLILFSDKMAKLLSFLPGKDFFPQAAACLICTQIGMLPWLIAMSGKESVLLFFTNLAGSLLSEGISLLCLPLSGLLLAFQAVPIILPLIRILFLPLGGLLYILAGMAFLSSDHSIQALRLNTVEPLLLFSLGALLLSFLLSRGFVSRNLRRILSVLLGIGIALQIFSYLQRPLCTVVFADVGQGDSALIMLDNKSILIDGGDIGSAKTILIPLLNYYGIKEPDITILTHLHRDHGSGIIELIEAGRVSCVYTPCLQPNKELAGLFSMEADNRVVLHSIAKGDKIVLSESAAIYVLSPDTISMEGGNEDSAVLFLTIGGTGVLFMGDAGQETEDKLLLQNRTVNILHEQADFIKIGHHGSKFSSSSEFLSEMSLDAAVISVGENHYGHPTEETLKRLAENDIDIYRTDFSGAVLLKIGKNTARIYEYYS